MRNSHTALTSVSQLALSLLLGSLTAFAQSQNNEAAAFRPPAVPLITHDPYFSIWSTTDNLADSETVHWTLSAQPINGEVRIDGKPYRFMGRVPGRRPDPIPAMQQTSIAVSPTHTRYEFQQDGVTIDFAFFTPALPEQHRYSLAACNLPDLGNQSNGRSTHKVSLLLDVDPVIAVNDRGQQVVLFRNQTAR